MSWGGSLWWKGTGTIQKKAFRKIAQQKTVDSQFSLKKSKSLQISYPICLETKGEKTQESLGHFWGHQLLAQMLLWGAFDLGMLFKDEDVVNEDLCEGNEMLIQFTGICTIRFWYTCMNIALRYGACVYAYFFFCGKPVWYDLFLLFVINSLTHSIFGMGWTSREMSQSTQANELRLPLSGSHVKPYWYGSRSNENPSIPGY